MNRAMPSTLIIRALGALCIASVIYVPPVLPQSVSESLLTPDNAYNPMPSPDGQLIAYVRVGWGESISSSMGRSSIVSDIKVMGKEGGATSRLLVESYFLSGWTPDSTRLVCFRDWNYAVVSMAGEHVEAGHIENGPTASERVTYSPSQGRVVEDASFGRGRAVPSPNGRYVAIFGDYPDSELTVLDLANHSSINLGKIRIHPDSNWSYIQPDWNPWFADSSRLVFVRDSTLMIVTPDGAVRTAIEIQGEAALPTPSPDGQSIAYVVFEPRPMNVRTDLEFWGGTTIMVVSASAGSKPRAITLKNPDEVYNLKWLNKDALVFDRVADELFYRQARIWKAIVPH